MKKIAMGSTFLALAVVGGVALCCLTTGHCPFGRLVARASWGRKQAQEALSEEARAALTRELVLIARQQTTAELRSWLVKQTPGVVERVLMDLDNTNDEFGRVRMSVLNTVYSLGSEGLDGEALHDWAALLRKLAAEMLHPGAERSDYVAKSYLMEGKRSEAAAEYRSVAESAQARWFFGQNPDLRAPASR